MTNNKIWSNKEDRVLLRWYRIDLNHLVELLPGRTRRAIILRAKRLGVKCRTWSTFEDLVISQCYPEYGPKYCQRYMAHKTIVAIQNRAAKLGIKRLLNKRRAEDPNGDIVAAWVRVINEPWH